MQAGLSKRSRTAASKRNTAIARASCRILGEALSNNGREFVSFYRSPCATIGSPAGLAITCKYASVAPPSRENK
jgi:hypothetical protein